MPLICLKKFDLEITKSFVFEIQALKSQSEVDGRQVVFQNHGPLILEWARIDSSPQMLDWARIDD